MTLSSVSLLVLSLLPACSGCDGCGGSPEIAPPPVAARNPTPPPVAPPVETATVAENTDEMMKTLLGLNQPAEAPVQPEVVARPSGRRPRPKYTPPEEVEEEPRGLSEHAFYAALDTWGGVKRCIAKTPNVRKDGSSAISVRFVVNQDGSVAESKILEKSNKHAEAIAPCVEVEAKRVRFPEFEEPKPAQKDAKFVF